MQNYNNSLYKIPANTLFMGKRVIFMPECHSTNDEAQRLVQNSEVLDGTIIVTNHQTAGRGQRGNQWLTQAGKNLTFSIILKPHFLAISDQIYLTMAISLGLFDGLKIMLPEDIIKIKWPNDLIADEKKVCGILIENHLTPSRITHAIVGIGMNINQDDFPFPFATSLKMLLGQEIDLSTCFASIVEHLESRYLMLRNGEFAMLKSDYLGNLYWMGESHIFSSRGRRFSGVISGVNQSGNLEVQMEDGEKTFGFKEIEYIR